MLKHIPDAHIYKLNFAEWEPQNTSNFELKLSKQLEEDVENKASVKIKKYHQLYDNPLDTVSISLYEQAQNIWNQYVEEVNRQIDRLFVGTLKYFGIDSFEDLLEDLKNGGQTYNKAIPHINETVLSMFVLNSNMGDYMSPPVFSTITSHEIAYKMYKEFTDDNFSETAEWLKGIWDSYYTKEDSNDC